MTIAVIFHCFYFDLLEEFYGYFSKIGTDFSLFVTIPSDCYKTEEVDRVKNDILKHYPNAVIISCNNYGADIYPCFCVMDYIKRQNLHFDKYIKVHTKKSLWKRSKTVGESWRKDLCSAIFDDFTSKVKLNGVVACESHSSNFLHSRRDKVIKNYYEQIFQYYNYEMPDNKSRYSVGTMFMIDGDIWEDFFDRYFNRPLNLSLMQDHAILETFERLWELLPVFYNKPINLV